MLDNHVYNLAKQLVQEHKSLWRIKNSYKEDAKECEKCQKLWEEMEEGKERYAKKIEETFRAHLS